MPQPLKCINAASFRKCAYVVGGTLKSILRFDCETETWDKVGEPLISERASCGVTVCCSKVHMLAINLVCVVNFLSKWTGKR